MTNTDILDEINNMRAKDKQLVLELGLLAFIQMKRNNITSREFITFLSGSKDNG